MSQQARLLAGLSALGTLHCASDDGAAPRDDAHVGAPDGSGAAGGSAGVGGTGGTGGVAPREPICDGSNDVRLMLSDGGAGGGLPQELGFTHPYGSSFAFVDGTCRFITGSRNERSYREGTLDANRAAELSNEPGWQSLEVLDGYEGEMCADCSTEIVSDGEHSMKWHGGASADPHEAERAILNWLYELWMLGEDSSGPVRVVVLPWSSPVGTLPEWPLAVELATLESHGELDASSGARFDDPTDTATLRALRAQATDDFPNQVMTVGVTAKGNAYRVSIRDDFPDGMAEGIQATWDETSR